MEQHYPCIFWFCNCRFSSQHDLDAHLKAMGTDSYTHRTALIYFYRKTGSPRINSLILTNNKLRFEKLNPQIKLGNVTE